MVNVLSCVVFSYTCKVNDIERFIVCTQLTLLDPHQTIGGVEKSPNLRDVIYE